MFIKLTTYEYGKKIVVRDDAIESFSESVGWTIVRAGGKLFEVRESVDEILAQLAGDPK